MRGEESTPRACCVHMLGRTGSRAPIVGERRCVGVEVARGWRRLRKQGDASPDPRHACRISVL